MKSINMLAALLCLSLVFSCRKEQIPQTDPGTQQKKNRVSENYLTKLHWLGVDTTSAFEYGGMIYAENDYMFSPKFLDTLNIKGKKDRGVSTEQYQTTTLLNYNNIRFYVPFDVRLEFNVYYGFANALFNWNTTGSNLHFYRIAEAAYDIDIRFYPLQWSPSGGVLAVADFPGYPDANGVAGYNILINKDFISYLHLTPAQIGKILAHEIGHHIGLRHTNWASNGEGSGPYGAIQIPGTPTSDPNSLMNAIFSASDNGSQVFSANDLTAINALYPSAGCTYSAYVDVPNTISGTYLSTGFWAPFLGPADSYEWEVSGPNGFYYHADDAESGPDFLAPGTYTIRHRFSTGSCLTPWAQKTVVVN